MPSGIGQTHIMLHRMGSTPTHPTGHPTHPTCHPTHPTQRPVGWLEAELARTQAASAAAAHPVEHDVSLSDAAEYLALYSLWYGLGGV